MRGAHRGDIISPLVMWIGVVLAVLIAASWFFTKLWPSQQDIYSVNFDTKSIRDAISQACSSIADYRRYNPRTERGWVTINATAVCINASYHSGATYRCARIDCPGSSTVAADLASFTFIIIDKQGVLEIFTDKTYPGDQQPPLLTGIRTVPPRGNSTMLFRVSAIPFDRSGIAWLAMELRNSSSAVEMLNMTSAYRFDGDFPSGGVLPSENYTVTIITADIYNNTATFPLATGFEVNATI
jgi:hypothetical protein